jgi:hypothetical protein
MRKNTIFLILTLSLLVASSKTFSAENALESSSSVSLEGKWSLAAKSPFASNMKIHLYLTFKKIDNSYFADIERKGGFLKESAVPVKIVGKKISFNRLVNEWKYFFTGEIISAGTIKGKFKFKDGDNDKGTFDFALSKIESTSPVKDISGTWIVSGRANYKLVLKLKGNRLNGSFTLPDNRKYSVSGTCYGNEIALTRYGYDWYEIYLAVSNDGGKTFRGKAIYSDKRVVVFTLSKPEARLDNFPSPNPPSSPIALPSVPQEPITPSAPHEFSAPIINGWKPVIKSKWGGWIIIEKGRTFIWWLDSLGVLHPIKFKNLIGKYSEDASVINFAPRTTNYADRFKIGLPITLKASPYNVEGKLYKDNTFTFDPARGKVVREIGSNKLWYIFAGSAHWISAEGLYTKLWGSDAEATLVPFGYLNKFEIGPNIAPR